MGLFHAISHAISHIAKPVSHLLGGASKLFFGSQPVIKYTNPSKVVLPRDDKLIQAYQSIDIVPDKSVKSKYIEAVEQYSEALKPLLENTQRMLTSSPPTFITPFGELPAYGLESASIKNYLSKVGLLSSLLNDIYLMPAELKYKLYYEQPLNVFLKEDLARYGVQATPYVTQGSPGLLGGILAAAAEPIGGWIGKKVLGWLGGVF